MIPREKIVELPRKYAIGKRPLSRVLGWGELTYTRILEGSVPSPQHEAEILRVLESPLTYLRLLDQAHDAGLVSDSSYEKSRKAALEYVENDAGTEGAMRAHAAATYLCVLAKGDITPHALQLLAYYAHGRSLAKLDSPLFDQMPRAADDGPAYDDIQAWFTFDRIQEIGSSSADTSEASLTEKECKLLKDVFEDYGKYSATKLQELACAEAPWKKARKGASEAGESPQAASISQKSMKKFFAKSSK